MSTKFWGRDSFCVYYKLIDRAACGSLCAVLVLHCPSRVLDLGFRVSVTWPLTYLAQGLNSFHCFYPWDSGKSVCGCFPTSQPCTHELGDMHSQWPQLSSLVGAPCLPCGANIPPPTHTHTQYYLSASSPDSGGQGPHGTWYPHVPLAWSPFTMEC